MEEGARARFARHLTARRPASQIYAILDGETCLRHGLDLLTVAAIWRDAGIKVVQYRDKTSSLTAIAKNTISLRRIFDGDGFFLILNDHPTLALDAGFSGVHIGQSDGEVEAVRAVVGEQLILGRSTHSVEQARTAGMQSVDYIAIGPVYETRSKGDAAPPVGLDGVRAVRAVGRKPLVAIGGIDLSRVRDTLSAGADCVAVISGLFPLEGEGSLSERARESLKEHHSPRAQDFSGALT